MNKYLKILNYILTPVVIAVFAGALADGLQPEPEQWWAREDWKPAVNPYLVAVIAYVVTLLATHWLIRSTQKSIKKQEVLFAYEQERLERLRASMTPAEWETYKVQLEIQKKLEAIRQNQNAPRRSYGYGMFIEPFD